MRFELDHDPASARIARTLVRDACVPTVENVDDVVLCASELVANALLHGKPPVELEIILAEDHVRVAVRDGGAATVERRALVSADTLSGRGLALVDAVASRWGAEDVSGGNVVWCEVSISR